MERLEAKMGKAAFIILNAISWGGYGYVILLNIADLKGWLLFIVCILYGGARLYFYIVKSNQERRMRELDIQEKQMKLSGKKVR